MRSTHEPDADRDQDTAPAATDPQPPITRAIRAVLDRHAVPERQRLGVLEAATGLSYQQVRRRMSGESPWHVDEIGRVASHFGEPLFALLATLVGDAGRPATLRLAGAALPCSVWIGPPTAAAGRIGALVAVSSPADDRWDIVPAAEAGDRPAHEVRRLVFEAAPPRRVAVLDLDDGLATDIVRFLSNKGLDAIAYRTIDELATALETTRFDGYIVDWTLGAARVGELLREVRRHSPDAPVVVQAPRSEVGSAHDGELEAALTAWRAQLYEKPSRPLGLFNALDLGFQRAPGGG